MNISPQKFSDRHLSMSDDLGKAAQVHPFNLDHYLHKETYTRVNQIAHSNNPLCDIEKSDCHALTESLCNSSYDYVRGILTVYLLSSANPISATYATAMHTIDVAKLAKEGYCMVMLYGLHRRYFVDSL